MAQDLSFFNELSSTEKEELSTRFTYHPPTEEQRIKYETLRPIAKDFAASVMALCPDSRERSLALTHIEEAVMWANAAIARRS